MHVSHARNPNYNQRPYVLQSMQLQVVKQYKYLGVILDHQHTFKQHTAQLLKTGGRNDLQIRQEKYTHQNYTTAGESATNSGNSVQFAIYYVKPETGTKTTLNNAITNAMVQQTSTQHTQTQYECNIRYTLCGYIATSYNMQIDTQMAKSQTTTR